MWFGQSICVLEQPYAFKNMCVGLIIIARVFLSIMDEINL
uniref:Uncharacterized protein n=1 Tax=Rhizophora mucronata TaxID=61149 RepID=A0A2P2Q5E8_RHIMU